MIAVTFVRAIARVGARARGAIFGLSVFAVLSFAVPAAHAANEAVTAITGATVIDGNGGAAIQDGVVVISGRKIAQVGKRGAVNIPRGAKTIDAKGQFVVPGFIDTNVHLDMNSELFPVLVWGDYESYFKFSPAVEGAQMALKYGVTTLLDTYGALLPLIKLRERINSGEIVGPRLLVAGNIIGWDGPLSAVETKRKPGEVKLWEKNYNAWWTQGTGGALTQMYPDEVKEAINKYIDIGPDFLKIGVTIHDVSSPIPLLFSQRVLKTMVDTAHQRGLTLQVHSGTVEGHLESVKAGIDVITHAESLYSQKLRPEFAKELCNSQTYFALFANETVGAYENLRGATGAGLAENAMSDEKVKTIESITPNRDRSNRVPPAIQSKLPGAHNPLTAFRKDNQIALYKAGCKIVVATDSSPPSYDDVAGHSRMHGDMGISTIDAIAGLVKQVGMTPAEAIVAATKNGAAAAGLSAQIGTLEPGKRADLLILNGDPLADIENIRKVARIVHDGQSIDPGSLPVTTRYYKR